MQTTALTSIYCQHFVTEANIHNKILAMGIRRGVGRLNVLFWFDEQQ